MSQEETLRLRMRWIEMFEQCHERIVSAAIPFYTYQNGKAIPAGSGVLLRISRKSFILTAAHVLDIQEILKLPLFIGANVQDGSLVPLFGAKFIRSPHSEKLDELKDYEELRHQESDPVDSGIIELPDELAEEIASRRRFVTLQEVDLLRPDRQGAFLMAGYPEKMAEVDNDQKTIVTTGFWCMVELDQPPIRDDGLAIHLHYPRTGVDLRGQEVEFPPPPGISGCAVWRVTEQSTREQNANWTPDDVKLIAIEHAWIKAKRRAIATPIVVAIQHIYQRYPDLRKIMDLHFGMVTSHWI